jgi:hypothetical protein
MGWVVHVACDEWEIHVKLDRKTLRKYITYMEDLGKGKGHPRTGHEGPEGE